MRKRSVAWMAICLSFATHLIGCPSCVGRLDKSNDPFFTNGFYENITKQSSITRQDEATDVEDKLGDTDEESD